MGNRLRRAVFRIDGHQVVDQRLRVDGYLSRTGTQEYSDGYGGTRIEYRPPDEVFDDDSLFSLRGMVLTDGHPPREMVDGANWRKYQVGHVGDDVAQADDGRHVSASVWVIDAKTQRRVLDGELTELSVGYYARLDETPGVSPEGERYDAVQRGIRGNHLALLKDGQARAGSSARLRLDASGDAILPDTEPPAVTAPGDHYRRDQQMKKIIRIDGVPFEVEVDDSFVAALEKERAALTDRAEEAEGRIAALESEAKNARSKADEAKARADAADEKVKKLEDELAKATDPKSLDERAAKRVELIDGARIVAGDPDFEVSGTDHEIRLAALEAAGYRADEDNPPSEDYVKARFDLMAEDARESGRRDGLDQARRAAAGPGRRAGRADRARRVDYSDIPAPSIDDAARKFKIGGE
jgi:hypothetical protein